MASQELKRLRRPDLHGFWEEFDIWLVEKHSDVTFTMTARFEPVRMWVDFFSKEHPFSRLQEVDFCILLLLSSIIKIASNCPKGPSCDSVNRNPCGEEVT